MVLVITPVVLGVALPAAAGDRPVNGRISFGRFDPAWADLSAATNSPRA
jgi:hypothetical protein